MRCRSAVSYALGSLLGATRGSSSDAKTSKSSIDDLAVGAGLLDRGRTDLRLDVLRSSSGSDEDFCEVGALNKDTGVRRVLSVANRTLGALEFRVVPDVARLSLWPLRRFEEYSVPAFWMKLFITWMRFCLISFLFLNSFGSLATTKRKSVDGAGASTLGGSCVTPS